MSISIFVTHTGVLPGGRPNTSSVYIKDVDFGFEQQNRKEAAYVPVGGTIRLPYTDKSAYSFTQGDIFGFTSVGIVTSRLSISGVLDYSTSIATTAGVTSVGIGVLQRFDASVLAPNAMVLQLPDTPLFNDVVGVKEVANSAVSITIDGNGNDLEGLGLPPAATQTVAIALVSLTFKFDGLVWRIV